MSHPYFYLRPKLLAGLLVLLSLHLLTACLGPATPSPQRVVSVGMALARGGLGDRSFNDSANAGLQRAQTELGVRFRVLDFDEDDQAANLRTLVEERHDLIIGVGQENAAPIETVAEEFPEQRFAVLDASVDAPNVTSVAFRELEGDFLAGALAAMLSPNGADQRWIAPEAVVTSRTKNLDVVIFTLLQELLAGELEPGIRTFDLASGGIGLAPIDGSGLTNDPSLVSSEVQQKMATIQRDLFDGKIPLQEFSP